MKTLKGKITSLARKKTATVLVTRQWQHPLYKKFVQRSKKYACHYEPDEIELELDEMVVIEECRPLSKTKHFKIVDKVGSQS
jgi:small subunit ribosomal protein S17